MKDEKKYVNEIIGLFEEGKDQQTDNYKNICLYGEKGVGKTHLIENKIIPELKQEGVKTLKISCIDYINDFSGNDETLRSSSFKIVSNFIKKNSASWDHENDKLNVTVKLSAISMITVFIMSLISVIFNYCIVESWVIIATYSATFSLALASFLIWFFTSYMRTQKKLLREKNLMLVKKKSKNKKYVIFIDDLNRLSEENQKIFIMKVSGITNFMTVSRNDIILVFITSSKIIHNEDSDFTYKFFAKIWQIKFNALDVKEYIKEENPELYDLKIFESFGNWRKTKEYIQVMNLEKKNMATQNFKLFNLKSLRTIWTLKTIANESEIYEEILQKLRFNSSIEFKLIWKFKKLLSQICNYEENFEEFFNWKNEFIFPILIGGNQADSEKYIDPFSESDERLDKSEFEKMSSKKKREVTEYNDEMEEYNQFQNNNKIVFSDTKEIISIKNRIFSKFLINPQILTYNDDEDKELNYLNFIIHAEKLASKNKNFEEYVDSCIEEDFWNSLFNDRGIGYIGCKISSMISVFLNNKLDDEKFWNDLSNDSFVITDNIDFLELYNKTIFNIDLQGSKTKEFSIDENIRGNIKKKINQNITYEKRTLFNFYIEHLDQKNKNGRSENYQIKHKIVSDFIVNCKKNNTKNNFDFQKILLFWWSTQFGEHYYKINTSFFDFLLGCIFEENFKFNEDVLSFILEQDEIISEKFSECLEIYINNELNQMKSMLNDSNNRDYAINSINFLHNLESFINKIRK